MPAISAFCGIIIRMSLRGGLPRRAQALVLEWAALHRDELMADSALCRQHQQPQQIQPLE